MMDINYLPLADVQQAHGVVVVIDVLRAFTTAAYAFNAGVLKIIPVSGIEEALRLKRKWPGSLTMGEIDGFKPEGFDFSNSPAQFRDIDLGGKILIQRTSAGTQGIVRAVNPDRLFAASFVVAKATARSIKLLKPDVVSMIVTGESMGRDGEEDRACGEYIQALLMGDNPDANDYVHRVCTSSVGRSFLDGKIKHMTNEDFEMCLQVDKFSFSLPIRRNGSLLIMDKYLFVP